MIFSKLHSHAIMNFTKTNQVPIWVALIGSASLGFSYILPSRYWTQRNNLLLQE